MSKRQSRVTALSKLTVVSSTPVESGKTHRFSPLDHSMGLHTLHLVFYYRDCGDRIQLARSPDEDRIRISLSELLNLYPPVTGRLARNQNGDWEVRCNDAGVRVLQAKVEASLDEWLRSADADEERDLAAWEEMPEDPKIWSPFRLQINYFEGGGKAIGLSCPHMYADPTCLTLLFKSWTEAYRREVIAHPPFIHPSALCRRPIETTNTKSLHHYTTKSTAKPIINKPTKMATTTFRFSGAVIRQSLSKIQRAFPNVTPFDFLSALFWTRVDRLKPLCHNRKRSLSICVDFRKLLQAPLPYGYFGNAQYFSILSVDHEIGEVGIMADEVHRHVESLRGEEMWSVIDWLESRKNENDKNTSPFGMYGPELTCMSMEHMIVPASSMIYEARFEKEEKPVHVSYRIGNLEGGGLIIIMPSPEEGLARTVAVTLPEEEMVKLLEDEAVMSLKPELITSGCRGGK